MTEAPSTAGGADAGTEGVASVAAVSSTAAVGARMTVVDRAATGEGMVIVDVAEGTNVGHGAVAGTLAM